MTELEKLFQCPVTKKALVKQNGRYFSDPNGPEYQEINGVPILVDFKQSILSEASTNSPIVRNRYSGIGLTIKRLVSPIKAITVNNINLMVDRLSAEGGVLPRILVIGGGSIGKGLESHYQSKKVELLSFDIYATPSTQFVADAHNIPLMDGVVDGVVVQTVLEHVLNPEVVVEEVFRVLKDQGVIYSETPFLQGVHEGPYDFVRYTESGHRYLFRKFECLNRGVVAGVGTQLLWSIEYFISALFRSRRIGKVIKVFLFWLSYFDQLASEKHSIDAASTVFFYGKKTASLKTELDIVTYYGGAQ